MDTFRTRLLAATREAAFPGDPVTDPATGRAVWAPDDAAVIGEICELFGITQLALQGDAVDVDCTINTVCTLSLEVGAHLQALAEAEGAGGPDRSDWDPDYAAYIDALWAGDREAVAAGAVRLGIAGGIPNGSPPLEEGPLRAG